MDAESLRAEMERRGLLKQDANPYAGEMARRGLLPKSDAPIVTATPVDEKQPIGLPRELARQGALTIRALLSGTGLGALADMIGIETPQNNTERVVQDAASAMASMAGVGAVSNALSKGATGVTKSIAELLGNVNKTGLAAAAGGGGAAGFARESGAGPMGQMVAGTAGSIAVPAGMGIASLIGRGGKNIIQPFLPGGIAQIVGRTGNEVAGQNVNSVKDALANPDDFVGSRVTAGEAAAKAGSPGFSGLQELVKGRTPASAAQYDSIAQGQARIRGDEIRSFGADEYHLNAAETARSAAANKNYGAAYADQIKGNPALLRLAKDPFIKDEFPIAMKLAKAKGLSPKTDLTQILHFVKIALDKQLSKTGNESLDTSSQSAVQSAKEKLIAWLGKANPKYDYARNEFIAASKPIDQMKVGQFLEDKLVAPMAEQGAGIQQRAAAYSQALRDAPRTIKSATGFQNEKLSDVLTPAQEAITENVGKDLARSAEHKRLASIGKESAQTIVGEIEPALPSGGFLDRAYTIARAISTRLHGKAQGKTLDAIAQAMQDPQEMLRLMVNAKPQERIVLKDYVSQSRNPILINAINNAFGGKQPITEMDE